MSIYDNMTAGQKAAYTRQQRTAAQERSPVGYRVAELMASGHESSSTIASTLGISDYQARGHMTRVRRGDFDSCRL